MSRLIGLDVNQVSSNPIHNCISIEIFQESLCKFQILIKSKYSSFILILKIGKILVYSQLLLFAVRILMALCNYLPGQKTGKYVL